MTGLERVIIFSTVWPEPSSSAAGVRQLQWVEFFRKKGAEVILSSPSKEKTPQDWGSENWSERWPEGVRILPLPLNESSVKNQLRELDPQVVMFDRFILEEQFGHFVYECCPHALVLVETQDLHFVRRAREATIKTGTPTVFKSETALRETASILRSDHAFVVSSFEEELLRTEFGIDSRRQSWVPFFYSEPFCAEFDRSFSERKNLCWIGNFRHAPNVDGLRWFRKEIWPLVRKRLPSVALNVYGAYPSQEVMEWNDPQSGFCVHGSAKDLETVFHSARLNIAPLRFGAGVKGKILEGWRRGVPVVTTPIGAEGFFAGSSAAGLFPGEVATSAVEFAEKIASLYEDEKRWNLHREQARRALTEVFSLSAQGQKLSTRIETLLEQKRKNELPTWTARMLRHELFNSHKYFSKWIEAKEAKAKKE